MHSNRFKVLIYLLVISALQSCSVAPEPVYGFEAQLALDIELIDEYVSENSLNVEIDDDFKIRYIIDSVGEGKTPLIGDTVLVNYDLFLLDGTFVDTSREQVARDNGKFNSNRSYLPLLFILGSQQIITGFQASTLLLREGGAGTFLIPSIYGYQNVGTANIPPNTNLVFKISIVDIR